MNMEFDEIRPYHDEELPQIYEELIAGSAGGVCCFPGSSL